VSNWVMVSLLALMSGFLGQHVQGKAALFAFLF
jgi:hypothetical protein